MDLGIKGKRALVLASSRGLGLGIAVALAREGANVLLCGAAANSWRPIARRSMPKAKAGPTGSGPISGTNASSR